jgi:hypothetical protein
VGPDDIYRVYFHGPAYRVLAGAWTGPDEAVGRFAEGLPDDRRPMTPPTVTRPRLLELAFQTAGVWELAHGRFAFPAALGRLEVAPVEPVGVPVSRVRPDPTGGWAGEVVDADGRVLVRLAGYRTVEVPGVAAGLDLSAFRGDGAIEG